MMRLTPHGRATFKAGPWNLGRYSFFSAVIASLWIPLLTIILCLPLEMPVTTTNANWAPLVFGATLIFVVGWWFFSARKSWTGIKRLISDEEMLELEAKVAGITADVDLKTSVGSEIAKV